MDELDAVVQRLLKLYEGYEGRGVDELGPLGTAAAVTAGIGAAGALAVGGGMAAERGYLGKTLQDAAHRPVAQAIERDVNHGVNKTIRAAYCGKGNSFKNVPCNPPTVRLFKDADDNSTTTGANNPAQSDD